MSRDMTIPAKWLCVQRRRWSAWVSWLCAQWVAKDPRFLHADSEDSDLSLHWAHTQFVGSVMSRLISSRKHIVLSFFSCSLSLMKEYFHWRTIVFVLDKNMTKYCTILYESLVGEYFLIAFMDVIISVWQKSLRRLFSLSRICLI